MPADRALIPLPLEPEVEVERTRQVAVLGCRQLRQLIEGVRLIAKAMGVWEYESFQLAHLEPEGRYDRELEAARSLDLEEFVRQLAAIAARPCEHYWTERTHDTALGVTDRACAYCGAIEVLGRRRMR